MTKLKLNKKEKIVSISFLVGVFIILPLLLITYNSIRFNGRVNKIIENNSEEIENIIKDNKQKVDLSVFEDLIYFNSYSEQLGYEIDEDITTQEIREKSKKRKIVNTTCEKINKKLSNLKNYSSCRIYVLKDGNYFQTISGNLYRPKLNPVSSVANEKLENVLSFLKLNQIFTYTDKKRRTLDFYFKEQENPIIIWNLSINVGDSSYYY